jgi:hypothetical protein
MKQLFFLFLISFLFCGIGLADDRCPLTGNVYILGEGDNQFELSGFDCTFGPGCEADCDLWYGNFDTGPVYHEILPFSCETNGDVVIAGLPCTLNSQGNLECLLVDTTGYHCQKFGAKTWCFSEWPDEFKFTREE